MSKNIRLYWAGGRRSMINFGDSLSPLLVSLLAGKAVEYADPHQCDIVAIGSILDKVIAKRWKRKISFRSEPIVVWGTGSFSADSLLKSYKFNIKAVRGPLTRMAMDLDTQTPIGDPGLLIDRIDVKAPKKYKWGIIPHNVDHSVPIIKDMQNNTMNSNIIDLRNPNLPETIKQIKQCEFIISSSLHGIISADALGIPNIWMSPSTNVIGANWKFNDYFTSVGRTISDPVPLQNNLKNLEPMAILSDQKIIEQRKLDLEISFKNIF